MAPVYGARHRRIRDEMIRNMPNGAECCRCHRPMFRTQKLELDHDDDDLTRYNGLAHASCNHRAGAVKGNRARGRVRHRGRPRPWHSRTW